MKKYVIIGIIFLFIIVVSIIGSILVTPNNEIDVVDDIMSIQSKLESDYSCYGYTIDNPKIVVNPYKIAPLSALIMFETKDKDKVSVFVVDKDGNKNKLYDEVRESKEHYLDIYGLYSNYDNRVIVVSKGIEYEYIVTTFLDVIISVNNIENNSFYNNNNDLIGINNNGEIVYYFIGYNNNIRQLKNGHLLVTSSRINNDGSYVGFSEIDMVGRIYNDYIIEAGYKNIIYVMDNGNYLIVSDDVIEIDKQNGKVLKRFNVNDINVSGIDYNSESNQVIVYCSDSVLYYDYDSKKLVDEKETVDIDNVDNRLLISNGNYFSKQKQNRFGNNQVTDVYKTSVNLLFDKKIDDDYKKCGFKFRKEYDRIIVNKKCDKDVILILDRFMDKRIYKIDKEEFYVNSRGLHGEYIIYVKIKDKIYNSGYYVKVM